MARKLFISVLGTTLYKPCIYIDHESKFESTETRFIQEATIQLIQQKKAWEEGDKICILATQKAQEDNWNKEITSRLNPHTKQEEPYEGLESILQRMNLPVDIEARTIPEGRNEEEIWEVFHTVFNQIEEGDELYFDLTHGFRYLPMLILVLGNYAKFLKHVQIAHISYGNFEGKEGNKAPITNLLPLALLQDWTIAAADFLQNGYTNKLKLLAEQSIEPLLRNEKTRTEDTKNLNSFVQSLQNWVDERQTCRGMSIVDSGTLKNLKLLGENIEKVIIKPLEPIFHQIMETLPDENATSIEQCMAAARWCYDNNLYQQAATILQEGVVTFFCQRNNINIDKEGERELINSAFTILFNTIPKSQWRGDKETQTRLEEILKDVLIYQPQIYSTFNNITEVRNDYNHSGFRSKRKPMSAEALKDNILKALNIFECCLTPEYERKVLSTRYFINLSNHPVEQWSKEQKEAAEEYGDIIEILFPQIPSEDDTKKIIKLANKYRGEIYKIAFPAKEVTVHIMGEMTFTYQLVQILQAQGIRCVASCTERHVEEMADGKKITKFVFTRFRDYNN